MRDKRYGTEVPVFKNHIPSKAKVNHVPHQKKQRITEIRNDMKLMYVAEPDILFLTPSLLLIENMNFTIIWSYLTNFSRDDNTF